MRAWSGTSVSRTSAQEISQPGSTRPESAPRPTSHYEASQSEKWST